MTNSLFSYDNKTVLVIGGATGMGAAATKLASSLGARTLVMDVAEVNYPVDAFLRIDLRNKDQIDATLAQINEPVDIVFACAGVADGTRGIMQINFISQRYIIDQLLSKKLLNQGGSVVMISSVAGLPWQVNLKQVSDFLSNTSWEAAEQWLETNPGNDNYSFSKQAINAYIAASALPMLQKGLRINAILPGPTNTPLAQANADVWLTFGNDYRQKAGVECLSPEQMASTMAFLGSDAASGINGITVLVDQGHVSSAIAGTHPEPAVNMMLGIQ